MKTICIAVLMLLIVAGCTTSATGTSGRKIDMRVVETIEKGKTTRWLLADKLGPPTSVSLTSDGKRVLTYVYTEVDSKTSVIPIMGSAETKMNYRQQMLQLICDQYGIVLDFLFNDIAP
jgi:outer membrane protein assembly factor BamE (lipoprotein component of BamABCDE complex)